MSPNANNRKDGNPSKSDIKPLEILHEHGNSVLSRRKFSSLIPPSSEYGLSSTSRIGNKTIRRPPSIAGSIRSYTSSIGSRKRKHSPVMTLQLLPTEILDQIFAYLPQDSLHKLLLTSRSLFDSASYILYQVPSFASTYRFAQFVTQVTHSPHYAKMVRELDLSHFGRDGEGVPMAGWREYKYRNELLYALNTPKRPLSPPLSPTRERQASPEVEQPKTVTTASHPEPNPYLKQWATTRDVPVGAVVHILVACIHIRHVNLSNLVLTTDYAVLSPRYRPTAFTQLIFVSDVAKSWTWKNGEIAELDTTSMIRRLTALPQLHTLTIRRSFWLVSNHVRLIVRDCPRLQAVDFRDSGMRQSVPWAVEARASTLSRLMEDQPMSP
ncbi:hypothetical protein MMC25_006543 [Agyrium rufum]|nr:hypothetical protein [Agyrium rufum]